MNILHYTTDTQAERNGKWFPFDDARFLIAANQCPGHKKALQRLSQTGDAQKATRKKDQAVLDKITIEAAAEGLLLGWENLKAGEKEFPYNRENAIQLLTQSREIREWVYEKAMDLANFTKEGDEAAKADLKSGGEMVPDVG